MEKLFDFKKKMEKKLTLNARPPKKTDFNNNTLKKNKLCPQQNSFGKTKVGVKKYNNTKKGFSENNFKNAITSSLVSVRRTGQSRW